MSFFFLLEFLLVVAILFFYGWMMSHEILNTVLHWNGRICLCLWPWGMILYWLGTCVASMKKLDGSARLFLNAIHQADLVAFLLFVCEAPRSTLGCRLDFNAWKRTATTQMWVKWTIMRIQALRKKLFGVSWKENRSCASTLTWTWGRDNPVICQTTNLWIALRASPSTWPF